MNSSSISESFQEQESLRRQNHILRIENQTLKQRLVNLSEPQEQTLIFREIKKVFGIINSQLKKYSLQTQDLADAYSFSLKEMFQIKNDIMAQKWKDLMNLLKLLSKDRKQNGKEEPIKKEVYFGEKKQVKVEEKPEAKVHYQRDDSPTQKFEKKNISKKVEEKESEPTQKKSERNIFAEMNSYPRNQPLDNPYLPEHQTKRERKDSRNKDQQQQKQSSVQPPRSDPPKIDDISLPLNWEKKTFFDYYNKTITKRFNDVYKKICTVSPLPRQGKHKIKFEMVTNGTVAFGIVTAPFKDEFMINDKKCDAVKYLSFQNGGGMLNLNGQCIGKGQSLHINPGQVLDIVFNANNVEVTFNNPKLRKPYEIRLPEQFKNKDLYLFLEMKQVNTAVKMI